MLDLPFNRQKLTISLRAASDLYEKLVQTTEGYAGVPIIHQAIAVKAAIESGDRTAIGQHGALSYPSDFVRNPFGRIVATGESCAGSNTRGALGCTTHAEMGASEYLPRTSPGVR